MASPVFLYVVAEGVRERVNPVRPCRQDDAMYKDGEAGLLAKSGARGVCLVGHSRPQQAPVN